MVAFSDVASPVTSTAPRNGWGKAHIKSGLKALAGIARFTGVVLMLAAVGIWIISGPLWDAEMMLVRLAVSVLFMCSGLMLLNAGRGQLRDEVHLDTRTQELRHIQRGPDGIARIKRSFALTELGQITVSDDQLILTAHGGDILLELSGLSREQLHLIDRELRKI
jgi:hypothetical protein